MNPGFEKKKKKPKHMVFIIADAKHFTFSILEYNLIHGLWLETK